MSEELFDVLAVTMAAPHTVRFLGTGKTEPNAEAIVRMAVMRRGVQTEFYVSVPSGQYRDGDTYPLSSTGKKIGSGT